MFDCRLITPADAGAVAMLARRAIESAGNLPAHVDMAKIRSAVAFFVEQEAGHFQMAAFHNGLPVAAIAAFAQEMPFFERCEAQVVMCFSAVAGAGMRLLRALVQWFRSDFRLRRLVWAMNPGFDPRLCRLARRLGFDTEAPMFIQYK